MRNGETVAQDVITIDIEMECSDEDSVEILEADRSCDELVSVLGKKYIQEVLEVDIDEENFEELNVFGDEISGDTDMINEVFEDDEPLSCENFTATECLEYYQLVSYFCVVKLSESEKQIQTEWKTTYLVDNSVELVDLTEG